MYESTKVAETIKTTSKMKGVQLKEMLAELELNKNTLSSMYNGSMLKADSLARIADYLDCSTDYLLGRTTNSSTNTSKTNKLIFSANNRESLNELQEFVSGLPEEQIKDLIDYIEFKKFQQEKHRKEPK